MPGAASPPILTLAVPLTTEKVIAPGVGTSLMPVGLTTLKLPETEAFVTVPFDAFTDMLHVAVLFPGMMG
ncbi:hypothetical protein CCAX7_46610 [Capsulimonas corticalis]|uniref:Uncharacterized protein n=1 Tax=Capsulimonas corticalis TaxID=2219043 RepID=A0A402D4W5_9BACT|nr:hypothetical protein CCAX7_46610 [Capsulimonas corticalis]